MDKFLALDKIIRDAYVAGDKDLLLKVAGVLALHADERTLGTVLRTLEDAEVSA
jgi:hypothetical protein